MRTTTHTTKTNVKAAPKKARIAKKAASTPKSFSGQIGTTLSNSVASMKKMDRGQLAWGVAGAATLGAGAYLLYRSWTTGKLASWFRTGEEAFESMTQNESSEVSDHLPLGVSGKKPSPSIRDEEGNYDIDGASYDVQGVIIGSDSSKDWNRSI